MRFSDPASALQALSQSDFRRRFRLQPRELAYAQRLGAEGLRRHALDFIRQRLAPAQPANDGKQTPMRGHPVFKAQHACACCCRGCLQKWHGIPQGKPLNEQETVYIYSLLLYWIDKQLELANVPTAPPSSPQQEFDFGD